MIHVSPRVDMLRYLQSFRGYLFSAKLTLSSDPESSPTSSSATPPRRKISNRLGNIIQLWGQKHGMHESNAEHTTVGAGSAQTEMYMM